MISLLTTIYNNIHSSIKDVQPHQIELPNQEKN